MDCYRTKYQTKNIDLPIEILKKLSIMAVAQGKSLKILKLRIM